MNSLELILRKIDEDASAAAEKIIQKANAQAEKIKAEEEAKANEEASEILEHAKKASAQLIENTQGSCESLKRAEELKTKSEIISGFIAEAVSSVKNLPDAEYFGVLASILQKYAHKDSGVLMLNAADLKRVPADFIQNLNSSLGDGASLVLSKEPADIDGGFIIAYGLIEENCSFEALLEDKQDEIRDRLFAVVNR